MYKRLFLLTLVFSLYMASLGFGQTPAGESTISIGEPSISASTAEVVKYEICGMLSHQHTSTCQSSIYDHPVTSEWKPDSSVYIQIKTQASGYGLARALLSKVIIDKKYRIGGDAGNASAINSQYVGDCGVVTGLLPWSARAQAYTDTMTVDCRHYEPAGTVGSTHEWTADGSVEAYSVEWSRSGGGSVGLEVSGGVSGKDPNFTTTITGSTHKGISSSYSGTATIAKPYPGPGASAGWAVSLKAKCGDDLCTVYDDMKGPHDHHAICGGCGIHIKCKRRPGTHVLHATCPKPHCDALNVWECSHTCGSDSGSSTDSTPNCPDCTTHCSSPCNCTNSGTCNGTVTDETPNCPDCTTHCSSPCSCTNSGTCNGTVTDNTPNCPDCTSHCSSPCSCTNSGTCNGAVYTPPPPPPTPSTPTTVACGGASYTGCSGASSRTEHHVPSCGNCSNSYWTCMSGAVDRHTDVKTCKRSGCGASLTRCQNGPGQCTNGGYHWL